MPEPVAEVAEKLEKIGASISAIRTDFEKKGAEDKETNVKHDKAWEDFEKKMTDMDEARKEEAKERIKEKESFDEKLAKFGAALTKAGKGSKSDELVEQKQLAHKAFIEWARTGTAPEDQGDADIKAAWAAETKTLTASVNTEGGVFIDPEFTTEIQKDIREFSPMRQIGTRISTVRSGQLRIPVRTSFTQAVWTGETQPRNDKSQPKYRQEVINTHEQSVTIPVSRQLLDEAEINFETEVNSEGGEALGANEAAGFTTGDGNVKPNGFLVDTRVSVQDTAVSNVLDADDLFDIVYDNLKTAHLNRSTWGMHRTWIKRFRKLKSSATGEYLLEFSDRKALTEGTNLTLLGRPVVEMPDMPVSSGTDGGKKAFVLANWFRFYWIVDSLGMTMIRDPFTAKDVGAVEFQMFTRTGGKVTLPEAGVILRIKA